MPRFLRKFHSTPLSLLLLSAGLAAPLGAGAEEPVRFTDTVPELGGRNLVPNGSFEVGSAGWSSLGEKGAGFENAWAPLIGNWGNLAVLHGEVRKDGAADGKSFLRIRLGGDNTPVFNFDYYYPVIHRELRPLAASLGWIQVTPGEPYTISVSMRASRDGVRGAFGVHNEDAGKGWDGAVEEVLQAVPLTRQWMRYSRTFTPKYPFLFVLAGPDLVREEDVDVDVDAVQLEKGAQATAFTPRGGPRTDVAPTFFNPQAGLEIGIEPTATAGVFTLGEPAALRITASNIAAKATSAEITFKVTDFADNTVEFPGVTLEIPAGAVVERRIPLPADWRGFYRVLAEFQVARGSDARLLRIAIVPPRTTAESVIGVNHAYPTKLLLGLAKKAGVGWCRDWSLKWQHIEPERGKYRWDLSDPQIDRVVAAGMSSMAMIPFPSAEWNSTAPDLDALKARSEHYRKGGIGDGGELILRARWAWPPSDVNELRDFVRTTVDRYRGKVQVWEFLNESLFTDYSLPDDMGFTAKDYLGLLRAIVPAIRAANPDARIIGGPGAGTSSDYTLELVKAGVMDSVDILDVHDYPEMSKPERLIESMDKLQAAMRAHGGSKPVWMTEFSYFGTDDLPRLPFVPVPGLWSEPQLHSEREVADYTVRYCAIFLGRGGERIFLHSGCTGSANHPGTESCLFADGAVRKVFPAMSVFTDRMGPSPRFVADRTQGGFIFAFETGAHATLVLWDPDEKATVSIPSGATCEDIMGRRVGGSSVRLTGSPVYLIGRPGDAGRILAACSEAP
jgi:hypothetical protein